MVSHTVRMKKQHACLRAAMLRNDISIHSLQVVRLDICAIEQHYHSLCIYKFPSFT